VVFTATTTVGTQFEKQLAAVVELAKADIGHSPKNAGDLIVVGRSIERMVGGIDVRPGPSAAMDIRKTLGIVAETIVTEVKGRGSVLVIQAAGRDLEG
jgi:hypothetical protein